MLKIYKNEIDNPKVTICKEIEDNTWIRLINPTEQGIKMVFSKLNIPSSLISQVVVRKRTTLG